MVEIKGTTINMTRGDTLIRNDRKLSLFWQSVNVPVMARNDKIIDMVE